MAKKETKNEKKGSAGSIILRPRVTEKAAMVAGNNVYTFMIDPRSNKVEAAAAFEVLFGKKPQKVRVIKVDARDYLRKGVKSKKPGYKKIYVYLKKGETIDFM